MPKLHFLTKPDLANEATPVGVVEILRPDLSLVGRVPTNGTINIDPGLYWATLNLPDGRSYTTQVEAGEKDMPVTFATLDDTPSGPEDGGERLHIASASPREQGDVLVDRSVISSLLAGSHIDLDGFFHPPRLTHGELTLLAHNSKTDKWDRNMAIFAPIFDEPAFMSNLPESINLPFEWQNLFARVDLRGLTPFITAIPEINFSFPRFNEGRLKINLVKGVAKPILAFLGLGKLSEALELAAGERVRWGVNLDSLAITYTLLRCGLVERAGEWLESIYYPNYRGEMHADFHILAAEYHARIGNYETAYGALFDLKQSWTPTLRGTLQFAVDRLRWYRDDPDKPEMPNHTARLLDRLGRLATLADPFEPVLTLRGDDAEAMLVSNGEGNAREQYIYS